MTVRIGNTGTACRRHPRGEDGEQAGERRRFLISAFRGQRSGWWHHLEFALLKSRG